MGQKLLSFYLIHVLGAAFVAMKMKRLAHFIGLLGRAAIIRAAIIRDAIMMYVYRVANLFYEGQALQ